MKHILQHHHELEIILVPTNNFCIDDFISRSSLANKRFEKEYSLLSDTLNATSVLVILVLIFFFRKS